MPDWDEREHILDYDSSVAMRYHGRRKMFLDNLARLDPALSIIFGGAAFGTIITGHAHLAAAASLLVAATSGVNLAFGLSDRARLHEDLFRRWGKLRAGLAALPHGDDVALRLLEVERAVIDAESPWQLEALSVICENEEKEVRREYPRFKVGWLQRVLSNWLTLPGYHPVEIGLDESGHKA